MALNQLSEKLDAISEEDLGFELGNETWLRIENRLDAKSGYSRFWMVAACLLLCLTFIPIKLLKQTNGIDYNQTLVEVVESQHIDIEVQNQHAFSSDIQAESRTKEFESLETRKTELVTLAGVSQPRLNLKPVVTLKETKHKPKFSVKDISIIQASLERPSIESGRTVSIRAQLEASTSEVKVNYQALKIKLYEKNE
ncbi:hypothetical protein [Ekhidna sp.]